ncbi:hypothetical protein KY290_000965 [Solanum tuberosum]|uniref:Uncharacterized protein n=1 Tax=Solanum tuberosum TaxID=4113 RepID=A0ABQ7WN11_SOLTU|nr:hypothetical protein KY290_000965 [Solanum tuberosum]
MKKLHQFISLKTETHSVLDYSTQWSSIPVSSQQPGKYTSTEEGSRITNDITREEDQHNHLIVDLNGEPLQLPIQQPPENNQPKKRSTRGKPKSLNIRKSLFYLNIQKSPRSVNPPLNPSLVKNILRQGSKERFKDGGRVYGQ